MLPLSTPTHAAAGRATGRLLTGRRTLLAGSVAASALALAGCSRGTAAAAGEDLGALTVNQNWIRTTEFAGEYFADSRGYYAEAGFSDVTLVPGGPSGTSSEAMVLSDSALVGMTTPLAAGSMVAEEEAPLVLIGAKFQRNPFTIYSTAQNPISSPADLVGKRIGVATGTNEVLFSSLLQVHGIDPADVEKVTVQFDPQPLMNGEVDGQIGTLTNEAVTVALAGIDVVNLPFAENGLPFVSGAFVTTRENIEEHRAELLAFLTAEVRGWKDALADPEESARLAYEVYGKDQGLDPEKETRQARAQNELVVSDETAASGLLTISDELAQKNVELLALAGHEVDASTFFDPTLLQDVFEAQPDLASA
ncbi:ABC transporter substrate-binding protein [Brachybacterium rhamnosum]|uniref:Thiamine pyrimidine synthase n=1 Tax=Brachybacterium rhamnosum TaxID=173361 RepID=A0ABW4PV26_9MICO